MSTQDGSIPVKVEEGVVVASVNGSMLLNLLFGMYTMVYSGTMYLYTCKKPANRHRSIVLYTISILYILCFIEIVLQWYFLNLAVIVDGDTRKSIVLSILGGGPERLGALDDFLFYLSFIVSDALLMLMAWQIWRCFIVWGQSLPVIILPCLLIIAEFGLFVTATVLESSGGRLTSQSQAKLFNNVASALVFASLGTTVVSTFLIGYRIHTVVRADGLPSKRLFSHVVVLVVESAAVYSIVLLVEAVSTVVPSFSRLGSAWYEAGYYWQALLIIVTGMAPTVLVARVALMNPNEISPPTIPHITSVHFESQRGSNDGSARGPDSSVGV